MADLRLVHKGILLKPFGTQLDIVSCANGPGLCTVFLADALEVAAESSRGFIKSFSPLGNELLQLFFIHLNSRGA